MKRRPASNSERGPSAFVPDQNNSLSASRVTFRLRTAPLIILQ
jgi:hypothetical protein